MKEPKARAISLFMVCFISFLFAACVTMTLFQTAMLQIGMASPYVTILVTAILYMIIGGLVIAAGFNKTAYHFLWFFQLGVILNAFGWYPFQNMEILQMLPYLLFSLPQLFYYSNSLLLAAKRKPR